MPQSFCRLYGHLIFSTKHRQPLLTPNVREPLHAYMAGILRKLGCADVHVGGVEDHVHILMALGKEYAFAKTVEILKRESSVQAKKLSEKLSRFYWQSGYGLFSVGPAHTKAVVVYIERQVQHHRKMEFKAEFLAFLKKYEIPYDERFVWD